jgi:DNA-binding response OmpR family regulator
MSGSVDSIGIPGMSARKTVLYVEDEPLIREISVLALEDAGFEVVVAENGRAALNALAKDALPISAVVTDINLGQGPNGWEVAKRARELHDALPVIYVTGADGQDWRTKGAQHSVMIGKPFTPDQLVAAVGSLLRRDQSP